MPTNPPAEMLSSQPPEEIVEVSAQVIVDQLTGELHHEPDTGNHFRKAREMRKDPVIALARRLALSIPLVSTWTIEADEEWEWLRKVIEDQVMPIRSHLMRSTFNGLMDFGWKPFEKVFEYVTPEPGQYEGGPPQILALDRIRPLMNDYTWARYNKWDGRFLGFAHIDQYNGQKLYIDAEHSLFVNFDEEGLGEYGESDMRKVEKAYDAWNDCNNAAQRYDRKMAGAFLVVKYKVGKTPYKNVLTDNSLIADDVIKALTSSGAVAIPIEEDRVNPGNKDWKEKWDLEFLSPQSVQASFVDRLMYLDKTKARAMAVTERSVFEGEFGTKADAAAHGDAMLLMHHLRHVGVAELYNWYLVNQLCVANGGPEAEGAVKIVAHPLSDENRELFMKIFEMMLSDPAKGLLMMDNIDEQEVMKSLEIPLRDNNELNMMPDPNAVGDPWRNDINSPGGVQITPFTSEQQVQLGLELASSKYSTVMAMLPEGLADHVRALQKRIDKDDVIKLEKEPHVTIKYGLHTDDWTDVAAVIGDSSPIKFTLYGMKVYSHDDQDVLCVDVFSDCLRKMNAKLVGALPFTDDYAVYNPHVTVAYLKKGAAQKYAGWQDLQGSEVILNEVVFSDPSHVYNVIKLTGDPKRTLGETSGGYALALEESNNGKST